MIRNFIFLILTLASLVWIFYAGQDLINFSGNENPEKLFGQEDGRVFILNRNKEIDISSTDFHLQPRLSELYHLLEPRLKLDEKMIVSEKKAHVVIEKNQPIDNERIKSLFAGENLIEVSSKKFLWKEFTLERNKGVLEIYIASEKLANTNEKWYSFDEKSACSIVQFNNGKPIVTDFYQKNGLISSYSRAPLLTVANKSVNDRDMFSNRIPVYVSYYQFIERDYAVRNDAVFQESVANKWANMGMVFFEYKDRAFLLMDFVKGKEPDLFLDTYRDLQSESSRHYKDLAITKNFPSNPKSGFYMQIFEDHVLFAENEQALVDLEASLVLGQMLSLNKGKCDEIYGQTPKSVCFREWSDEVKVAKSMYNGSALTVKVSTVNKLAKKIENTVEPTGMSLDSPGKMLLVHPTRDMQYAVSENHQLFGFSNGKNTFKLPLEETVKGKIRWLDDTQSTVVISGLSKIHVVSESGNQHAGFPVEITEGISKEVSIFNWKGKPNFLIATNTGNYIWLDENGEQKSTGKMEITNLTAKPIAWVSQRRLFFGFHGDGEFAMIEAEKNKLLRTFPLPIGAIPAVLSNELVFYSLEEKVLSKFNQRGQKSKITVHSNAKWMKADLREDGSFYVLDGKQMIHYSSSGKKVSALQTSVGSIDGITRTDKTSKGVVTAVVDDINNQIWVYNSSGKVIPMNNNQGQTSVGISVFSGQSKLYTLSDKFVIHYVL